MSKFGKAGVKEKTYCQCSESLERAGDTRMKLIFGGSNTIGANDRFPKRTENLHGGISVNPGAPNIFLKSL